VATFDRLYGQEDEAGKARLMAFSTKHAGSWLEALPTERLKLSNNQVQVLVKFRLGSTYSRRWILARSV
jgi:hypothetical protein